MVFLLYITYNGYITRNSKILFPSASLQKQQTHGGASCARSVDRWESKAGNPRWDVVSKEEQDAWERGISLPCA